MARPTLVLSEDSWHVKVYRFWQRYGKLKTTGYKENLCHYWRVVVFWAAWRAFVSYPLVGEVPAVVLVLGVVAVGLIVVGAIYAPWFVLVLLGALGLGVVGAAVGAWVDRNPQEAKAWARKWLWSWFQFIARPIAWGAVKIGHGIVWLAGTVAEWFEPETWGKIGAVLLFGSFGTVVIASVVAAFLNNWVASLIALGIILVVLGLAAGTIVAYLERKKSHVKREAPGMGRVSYEYVVAGKHRICPFIEIEK